MAAATSLLVPHLSALATVFILGWTTITIPPNDTLRRIAMFPLVLAPIICTMITAVHAGPIQLWNIYVGMMLGTQLAPWAFHILFVAREGYPTRTKHGAGNAQTLWTDLYNKACFSVDLVLNKRRINRPDQVGHVPAFNSSHPSYVPSRRQFLIFRSIRFILFYLALDILTLQDLEDAEAKCAPGQERILSRLLNNGISGPEFGEVVGMVIAYGVCGAISLTGCCDFVSVLSVGTGMSQVRDWPPLFGNVRRAYSLRRFWGLFWHQQFRIVLSSISGVLVHDIMRLPGRSSLWPSERSQAASRTPSKATLILTRYVKLFVALILSGTLHLNSDRVQGVSPRESGAVKFFFWQGVGIVLEDIAQAAYSRFHRGSERMASEKKENQVEDDRPAVWTRALGFAWVFVYMVLVAPVWMFPVLRAGQATVVPVSVVRWMVK